VNKQPAMQIGSSIQSLQVLRGMAALTVVAFHTCVILAQREYGGIIVEIPGALNGWLGVNFFFALSGYIIFHAHRQDIGNSKMLPKYFWKRFTRLYPIYWIFLTVYIAAAALGFGHPDFKWEARHMFTAYTLFNIVDLPTLPLKVAWTLLFEVKFYLIFALVIVAPRLGGFLLWGWGIAILVRNSYVPLPDWGYLAPDWGMLSLWNIYFLFGMLACWAVNTLRLNFGLSVLGLGICVLALAASQLNGNMDVDSLSLKLMLALAIAFSLVISGIVLFERRFNWTFPPLLLLIGDASYSIYLVHSAAISQMAQFNLKHTFHKIPSLMLFFIIFVIAGAVGIAAHILVERPLLLRLRKFGARAARASETPINIELHQIR
jgi:exopolysaccharide production protein ExoZ